MPDHYADQVTTGQPLRHPTQLSDDELVRHREYLHRWQYYQPEPDHDNGLDALYYGHPKGDETEQCLADWKGLPNKSGARHWCKMVSPHNVVPFVCNADSASLARDFGLESFNVDDDSPPAQDDGTAERQKAEQQRVEQVPGGPAEPEVTVSVEGDNESTEYVRAVIAESEQTGHWSFASLFSTGAAAGDVWAGVYAAEDYEAQLYPSGVRVSVEHPMIVYPELDAHDQRQLYAYRVQYQAKMSAPLPTMPGQLVTGGVYRTYTEIHELDQITAWLDSEQIEERSGPNPLAKLGRLPFVHFSHIDSGGFFGYPAAHGVYDEIDRLNVLESWMDAAIIMHALPKVIFWGSNSKEDESYWSMRIARGEPNPQGRVEVVKWPVDYGYLAQIRQRKEALVSRLPQFAIQEAYTSGGAEAATTVRYRLFALDNYIAALEDNYARGLRELIVRILYLGKGIEVHPRQIKIDFGERFPFDTQAKLEKWGMYFEHFGMVRKLAFEAMRDLGWSEDDANEVAEQVSKSTAPGTPMSAIRDRIGAARQTRTEQRQATPAANRGPQIPEAPQIGGGGF